MANGLLERPVRETGVEGPAGIERQSAWRNAVRYWEPRRALYNLILLIVVIAWAAGTWPHFRPAVRLDSLIPLGVLAILANICYSAGYLVDVPAQGGEHAEAWRRWRTILWLAGTLFAVLFENYWIADEIYPVGPVDALGAGSRNAWNTPSAPGNP